MKGMTMNNLPQSEIDILKSLIKVKKEEARYLAGNKKGLWGRITSADVKRGEEIRKLESQLYRMNHG